MKILLTGGAGFIGSWLTEFLIAKGHKVIVIDNLSHPIKNFQLVIKKAKFYREDVKNFSSLKAIFLKEKPEVVNHHAACLGNKNSNMILFQTNVLGTLNLLRLAKKYRVKKFIFASSAAVYGDSKTFPTPEETKLEPLSSYGISKLIAEYFLKLYQNEFQVAIFRYSNVYGERQDSSSEGGVVSIFKKRIKEGKDCLIYGDGRQERDFINVSDVVEANLRILKKTKEKKFLVLNISSSKSIKISKLFNLMKKIMAIKTNPRYLPARRGEIFKSLLDNSKAKEILGWQPKINLEEGLRQMILELR